MGNRNHETTESEGRMVETEEVEPEVEKAEKRKAAIDRLNRTASEDALWDTIVLHEGYPFFTFKNLEFTYRVSGGEIFIDRKQKSKSITKSTVFMAYRIAKQRMAEEGFVKGPKKLETFGASYLYPMFIYFGIIKPQM